MVCSPGISDLLDRDLCALANDLECQDHSPSRGPQLPKSRKELDLMRTLFPSILTVRDIGSMAPTKFNPCCNF